MRALLVPVKSFAEAKHRLADVLLPADRAELARQLGAIVLAANRGLPTYVACDDGAVADWAVGQGASVLWTPRLGLSGAVNAGVSHLAELGFSLAVVAHADLPLVTSLVDFGDEEVVTLAPDWREDGTNVAAVPTTSGFQFAYGLGSFQRHCAEAERLGLPLQITRDNALARDVDFPADLYLVSDLLERVGIRPTAVAGDY